MMKFAMTAMIAVGFLTFAQNSAAEPHPPSAGYQCMASCSAGITLDTGVTGERCDATTTTCTCQGLADTYGVGCMTISTSCGAGYSDWGPTVAGKRCCLANSGGACFTDGGGAAVTSVKEIEKPSTQSLRDVFETKLTDVHYGYANDVLRSPNAGRGNSAHAKLDACLFYSDVDNLGTGYTGWDTCKNSTTLGCNASNKNEYCMNNGASVCEDRCDCVFTGFATCDGL